MATSLLHNMDSSEKKKGKKLDDLPIELIRYIFLFLAFTDLHSFLLALNLDKEEVYRQLRKRHDGEKIVVMPIGDTIIGSQAFSDCSSLKCIYIPDSITSIEKRAFSYCSSLTSVVIPGSVTSIEKRAFSYCSSLTSVVIPGSVTCIGEDAFSRCKGAKV